LRRRPHRPCLRAAAPLRSRLPRCWAPAPRKCRGVEPATPSSPNSFPNHFARLDLRGRRIGAVRQPRGADAVAFSVKLSPTRVLRPMPSNSRQIIGGIDAACMMKSSTSQPRSLTGSAVTTLERLPSITHGARHVVFAAASRPGTGELRTRPKPGSKRSITCRRRRSPFASRRTISGFRQPFTFPDF